MQLVLEEGGLVAASTPPSHPPLSTVLVIVILSVSEESHCFIGHQMFRIISMQKLLTATKFCTFGML